MNRSRDDKPKISINSIIHDINLLANMRVFIFQKDIFGIHKKRSGGIFDTLF
jgi:hypothetical protein